jgi:hypothetical protein
MIEATVPTHTYAAVGIRAGGVLDGLRPVEATPSR